MSPHFPLTFSNGTVTITVGAPSQEEVGQTLGTRLLIGWPRTKEGRVR